MTKLERPPHSPDLAKAEFYLFRPLKSGLRGRNFRDATDIIKNATEELQRLSQTDIQDCLKHLYSRWQKCVFSQWGYFEGLYCFVFLRNKVILGTLWTCHVDATICNVHFTLLALRDVCKFVKHSNYNASIRLHLGFTGVRLSFAVELTVLMEEWITSREGYSCSCVQDVCTSGGTTHSVLTFGTRWNWVLRFSHRRLYARGKSPNYPVNKRLNEP